MIIDKREQILNGPKYFLRNVSVSNVIFGYHEKMLKVLLQLPAGTNKWLLPIGYIKRIETIEEAASRTIEARTKLKNLNLKKRKPFQWIRCSTTLSHCIQGIKKIKINLI